MAHGTTTERVKPLLKPAARASGVALGKAVERFLRVCWSMYSFYIVLISSAEISVTTVAAFFYFKFFLLMNMNSGTSTLARPCTNMCGPWGSRLSETPPILVAGFEKLWRTLKKLTSGWTVKRKDKDEDVERELIYICIVAFYLDQCGNCDKSFR